MLAARLCTRVSLARPLVAPLASVQPLVVRQFHMTPKAMDASMEQASKFIGAGELSLFLIFGHLIFGV